jgi:hypothetical protein
LYQMSEFFPINYIICPKDGIKLRNSPRKKKRITIKINSNRLPQLQ